MLITGKHTSDGRNLCNSQHKNKNKYANERY